jgi:hypothetical protein
VRRGRPQLVQQRGQRLRCRRLLIHSARIIHQASQTQRRLGKVRTCLGGQTANLLRDTRLHRRGRCFAASRPTRT